MAQRNPCITVFGICPNEITTAVACAVKAAGRTSFSPLSSLLVIFLVSYCRAAPTISVALRIVSVPLIKYFEVVMKVARLHEFINFRKKN